MRREMEDAEAIFRAGVKRVDPILLMEKYVHLDGKNLIVNGRNGSTEYDLDEFQHVFVVGMGKASAKLAEGVEKTLGKRIDRGFVVTKSAEVKSVGRIRIVEAGHPVPDIRSVEATNEILGIASDVRDFESRGEKCIVIVLVSGGGSALLCAPAEGIALTDKSETTRLLLSSGATIQEMNTVRKHLSAVKGGRLAKAFMPAKVLTLVLSDVVGDDLDVIASGPTVPDSSTWRDAKSVLVRRGIFNKVSGSVRALLEKGIAGEIADTPKQGDLLFANVSTILIGNNLSALESAAVEADRRGYGTLLLSSRIVGEAREIAKVYLAIAQDIMGSGIPVHRPACILCGGETTVTLKGDGLGGRNQEMALAFLSGIETAGNIGEATFLSAGTDGNDGPTDAAGAFAYSELLGKSQTLGLDPAAYLSDNDSYSFFSKCDGLLKTGHTGTNVCDIQILLVP
jgi:hydroxypyruvate reductase